MRCPTCAAFVEDDATSCTSCGSEIAVGAPPPMPPEFEAPADPGGGPPAGPDSGSAPSRRPSSASGDPGICDGCQNTFPPMQLSRIHGQRLCDDCADRADRSSSSSGSHQVPGSGSGRVPAASGSQKQAVSKGPLVVVGAVAVALVGVAVYFTVIAPGAAGSTTPNTGAVNRPTPAPQPVVAPPVAPVPTPIKRPEDITIQGTLQPFERTPNGDVPQIEFKDAMNDKSLVVTGTDRYVAEDLTPGKRYNVSFRGIRADSGHQVVKYSLDIEFEQVEGGG